MVTRRTFLTGLIGSTVLPAAVKAASEDRDIEPEFLRDWLRAGRIPPMADRLPAHPRIVNMRAAGRQPGVYGGTVRTIIGSQKDIRYMTVYGYSRLVGYDKHLVFQPDILLGFESTDDTVFTFHLREGHRWSDGHPFTVDDFQYWWEDVILDKNLTPGGGALELRPHGNLPKFEVVDNLTVRYSWERPNPMFMPALAGPLPLVIFGPGHYLKQFHKKYQDDFRLSALMKQNRVKKWADLHIKMSRASRPENPELPTLDPWQNTTPLPSEQFVFVRNPFFHRVDENGVQLPYIDKFILNVSSSSIIAAKAGAGESDLQATGVDFNDYTFLKDAEKRFPVKVNLWKQVRGSRVALLPNLNCADDVWRKLFRETRVRRALSLAIDRHEINMVAFYGLGKASADTVLPDSPLFRQEYADAFIAHDKDQANKLLDEVGLKDRDDEGIRLLPDGRRAEITVETAGESNLDTDVLELVRDHWREVGIALYTRTSQRDVFRSRAMSGTIMMSIWYGIENGVATADMSPGQLAPTMDDQLQWPLWGMHYLSAGQEGSPPDLPEVQQLVDLLKHWGDTMRFEEREVIWHQMLSLYTQQVFSIGLINSTLQPILSSAKLQNVPTEALYGFDPTSYLGLYMPDSFWFKEA
ncbi:MULTISPECIES: ABC transporter substrate-binding protein [unclassified Rhizobium]|uniref:ABC transporter substrate-binding protein n=1 Tax=unclassified Rhizobium TaxID=2613769 RepID=UPI0016208C17|nr:MULTISPECIES: ABC transporter substrate-binding protein [unclassified Rhizobium]MBB3319052.1 peptide/nickel transport system substrate-binding protein [Rhizobium sp. BK181]MBB3544137.1 peptide/nickel transport system substrate-binding protein [Rhizobium sp. BK399]MCS4094703.1 peptide/nickel transport system substrate-binding protein [Rhizobium sp. BK176]